MKSRRSAEFAAIAVAAALLLGVTVSGASAQPAPTPSDPPPAAAAEPPPSGRDAAQRGIAGQTIDRVRQAAKTAGDVLTRVPCLAPKGGGKSMGSLPHVARKLIAGQPVVIVAFGSSSTQGYGSSSPAHNYPNRLAERLRRHYPGADISVINSGKGGEDAPEMMARLKATVLDAKPDLVIWQVGTNAILRNLDPTETGRLVEEGIAAIQAAGSDVVLVDPQYAPRVNERAESAGKMIAALGRLAELRRVAIFPRFQVMKEWHERQALPFEDFVIDDGLHMNDWGYACFAQLLADDIVRSVGQIKLGVTVPADVRAYRPM
ncbi:Lipolytic enzyme, G-D-S-L [Rhodopseudomonas palustris HaA2]|uniref:Lipolytic enzyme, G-D-S-L n=1 Tax=Rhodopseudomonas palustris (strain HaA2) TaxID=316058 RepID=Q2J209_RHOP2|nr:SGNH/GDSL hydrolase family protein [Rhodopseudomonas palustris]ABD05501.1 Lipolytic enzyme, G-D-S-L [Rhodopseudomonas palustris HaA2]